MSAVNRWARLSVRDVIAGPGEAPSADRLTPYVDHATPPVAAPPGHVVLSLVTDSGMPALAILPATHRLLSYALGRRSTRVRDVAPDVTLPEPTDRAPEPLPASYETGRLPYRFRRIRLLPNHPAYDPAVHA